MQLLFKKYSITALMGLAVIAIWFLLTKYMDILNPVIFPEPSQVVTSFHDKYSELIKGLVNSMKLLIPGFLLAMITGIIGGLYFGLHSKMRQVFMPYFHTLSPIPPTLFIPYAIAILPSFKTASVFLIFLGSFWPIFLGTIQGVMLIEKPYLDNAKALGLRGVDFIFKVVLPASSPYILNGAGTSLGFSFLILTIAEMFGAESGMGYFIQYYADFSQYQHVLAGIFFNSIVILIIMLSFDRIKKKLLFWTNMQDNPK